MADDIDFKKLGEKLIEKNVQATQPIWKYKKKYAEYKDLYETGRKFVDPDTRSATAFKELLGYALKRAGKLLGENLTKSPYYILNQKGLDALFEAVAAMDTINNARKLIDDAEANLAKLAPKVTDFYNESNQKHKEYYDAIKLQLKRPGVEWTKYVENLNMDRFWKDTRAEAQDEIINALQIAEMLLKDVKPIVDQVLIYGPTVYANYTALVAAGASIVLAEKVAQEKVAKLAGSSSTVSHGFGTLEQARQRTERDLQGLYNEKSKGKSLGERVDKLFDDVQTYTMRDWNSLMENCLGARVLMIGVPGGGELPWDLTLPKE